MVNSRIHIEHMFDSSQRVRQNGSTSKIGQRAGVVKFGKHAGFRCRCSQELGGSSPSARIELLTSGQWPNWLRHRSPKPAIPGSSPGCPARIPWLYRPKSRFAGGSAAALPRIDGEVNGGQRKSKKAVFDPFHSPGHSLRRCTHGADCPVLPAAMRFDCFFHPIRLVFEGHREQRLPAIAIANLLDEAVRLEQSHPVAHRLIGLVDPGGYLRYRKRPAIEEAAQHVQAPVVLHDRFQPGRIHATPGKLCPGRSWEVKRPGRFCGTRSRPAIRGSDSPGRPKARRKRQEIESDRPVFCSLPDPYAHPCLLLTPRAPS